MKKRNEKRKGDSRPFKHKKGIPLNLHPDHDEPFRWLPRHGEPSCIGEWLSQQWIKALACVPIYIAVVVTLTLVFQIWIVSKL